MATAERDVTYTMGRSEGETERLIEQAHLYEKMTLCETIAHPATPVVNKLVEWGR